MSARRGFLAALVDRFVGKRAGLPPEKCDYTVSEVRIPVCDGDETFELIGELYQPVLPDASAKLCGTVLVQCPYGRGIEMTLSYARLYAARGYQVLFVSCRGTFGSGGAWQPFRTEAYDGQVIVRWMRDQAWYTGSFATVGMSFLAYTQLALLNDPPEDMVAAVMEVGPHDIGEFSWGTGAMAMDLVIWSEAVKRQGEPGIFNMFGLLYRIWSQLGAASRLEPVFADVPFQDAVKKHFGPRSPWVHDWIAHSHPSDPYYEPMRHQRALDSAKIPILLTAGWHDLFLTQSLEQYRRLSAHNDKVRMTVGPWSHMQIRGTSIETFSWLETYLANHIDANSQQMKWDDAAVRIFITGLGEWRLLPQWPPAGAKPHAFFLHPDHTLSQSSPPETTTAPSPCFTFSPHSPTPTIGGPFLGLPAGIRDDTALAVRRDVLTFTTAPFESPLQIFGAPAASLAHESDNPHVDLFVRISEVGPDGHSKNVTEGYRRLDPKRKKGEKVSVVLRECAHVFCKGSRMRVYVAGGSSKVWHRNPGTDGGVRATELKDAKHWIHVGGAAGVSKLMMPVLEGSLPGVADGSK